MKTWMVRVVNKIRRQRAKIKLFHDLSKYTFDAVSVPIRVTKLVPVFPAIKNLAT